MAVLKKEKGENFPTDVYIFGKGVFTGGQLPIGENVISVVSGTMNKAADIGTTAAKAVTSDSGVLSFIADNWKLLSIGVVALVVLLKD